jgi:hypothetical protein
MPTIIDYARVCSWMQERGWRCVYHNSGAFGLPQEVQALYAGWIGPADPTIRPEMLARATSVAPPFEESLARHVAEAWATLLPGDVWLMPASHWAFELDHSAHKAWLPRTLQEIGVEATDLASRTDAAAIAFTTAEQQAFGQTLRALLNQLQSSDFTLAFPHHPAVALVHHHQQIWWTTSDPALAGQLRLLPDRE